MPVSKFISTSKLFEYLDSEVSEALMRHGIASLYNYAWQDEKTPSDEYIGLAKWSSDGIHALEYVESPDAYYTRDEHERLQLICDDMELLMEISRLAIGHTLWMAELVKSNAFDHNHYFWLNHINSMTLLGMVSDRVRDLFLAIYFRTDSDQYKVDYQDERIGDLKPGFYQYPFAHAQQNYASNLASTPYLCDIENELRELCLLAGVIFDRRVARNATVHDVATRAGHLTKRYYEKRKNGSLLEGGDGTDSPEKKWDQHVAKHSMLIDAAVSDTSKWYLDLVKATSLVFDVEYALRQAEVIRRVIASVTEAVNGN